ncbi:MAG: hypothetical protein KAG82_06105 [Alcanivoracaceae bacterium]|jgi:hypothetical protein|nr:hypothetical protein [Alcanivoracaceae bacterium]
MILVLCRHTPDDPGFAEWQDLLLTLTLFELPITLVLSDRVAACANDVRLQQRLQQLQEIGLRDCLAQASQPLPARLPLPCRNIDDLALRSLCRSASHVVHC